MGDSGSIPGSGKSFGGGHGNSLQFSLGNSRDGEPVGLQSMELQRVRHDWATQAHTLLESTKPAPLIFVVTIFIKIESAEWHQAWVGSVESPWLVVSLQLVSCNEALSGEECSNPVTQDAEMNRVDINCQRRTAIKITTGFQLRSIWTLRTKGDTGK